MKTQHAWSSDPVAQAAIRRAEDGRSEPVPTLTEVIERQRETMTHKGDGMSDRLLTDMVQITEGETLANVRNDQGGRPMPKWNPPALHPSLSAQPAETDGLRTERVTLELRCASDPSKWEWVEILSKWGIQPHVLESVRVVPSSEADAEIERLRGEVAAKHDYACRMDGLASERMIEIQSLKAELAKARARVAELEKHQGGEAVAWATLWPDKSIDALCISKNRAKQCAGRDGTVVPLFRAPQPLITEEERSTLQFVVSEAKRTYHRKYEHVKACIEGLLARSGNAPAFTLTAEEREAVEEYAAICDSQAQAWREGNPGEECPWVRSAEVASGLLKRAGGA